MNAREVVGNLRQPALRLRIGLWLMPHTLLDNEVEQATRLGIEAVDLRAALLRELQPDTKYVGLWRQDGNDRLLRTIQAVCSNPAEKDCLLGYNLDLLLAGLSYDGRRAFWRQVFGGLPYPRNALLLVLSERADELLPSENVLEELERDSRLARGHF